MIDNDNPKIINLPSSLKLIKLLIIFNGIKEILIFPFIKNKGIKKEIIIEKLTSLKIKKVKGKRKYGAI